MCISRDQGHSYMFLRQLPALARLRQRWGTSLLRLPPVRVLPPLPEPDFALVVGSWLCIGWRGRGGPRSLGFLKVKEMNPHPSSKSHRLGDFQLVANLSEPIPTLCLGDGTCSQAAQDVVSQPTQCAWHSGSGPRLLGLLCLLSQGSGRPTKVPCDSPRHS